MKYTAVGTKASRRNLPIFAALLLIVLSFLVSTLTPFIQKTDAAAVNWTAVRIDAAKYSWYKALSSCIQANYGGDIKFYSSVSVSGSALSLRTDLLKWASNTTGPTVPVGLAAQQINSHYNGNDGKDGLMQCSFVADAFADEVSSRADFLTGMGYKEITYPTRGKNWEFSDTSKIIPNTKQPIYSFVSKQTVLDNLAAYARSKGVPTSSSDYIDYYLFYSAFTTANGVACGAGNFTSTSSTTGAGSGQPSIKFFNPGNGVYDTYYYTLTTSSPSTSLYVVPTNTTTYSCGGIQTQLETRSSTLAATIAKKDMADAITAAANVYAAGIPGTDGICSPYGTGQGAGAAEYNACVVAIVQCLQPVTIGAGVGGAASTTYTYADMPADRFGSCLAGILKGDPAQFAKTYTALQANANTAAGAQISQADPCLATPGGNDASGQPCTKNTSDPCGSIPADTAMPWLACSIYSAVYSMTSKMSDTMEGILKTSPEELNTLFSGTGSIKKTSDTFRNLALTLIVIAGLVMVVAQATGTDLIDAYTVKKVLPKLGVAVVGIALSWPILRFAVGLSNDLGGVVTGLFSTVTQHSGVITSATTGNDIMGFFFTAAGATGVVVTLGFWGAILLLVSLLISFLTGLIVLMMQKLFMIVLIVIAPLAIASYVLPGTEKFWKMWKTNFAKVFILYFVVMVIIRVGDFLATLSFMTGSDLLGVLAKVATLLLTFKAPQFAGQILGGVMGAISGTAYKMAGAAKAPVDNARRANTKQRNQEMMQGRRFNDEHAVGRLMNRAGSAIPLLKARNIGSGKWAAARSAQASAHSEEFQTDAAVKAVLGNDDLLRAGLHGNGSTEDIRTYLRNLGQTGAVLDQNVSSVVQARQAMGKTAYEDFAAANVAGTGTGYKGGFSEMAASINHVAGGDRARATRILNKARQAAQQAKRIDLYGAGFGNSADQLQQLFEGRTTAAAADEVITDEALRTKSAGEVATARNNGLTNMMPALLRETGSRQAAMQAAITAGGSAPTAAQQADIGTTTHAYKRMLAQTASILDTASYASPENNELIGGLMGQQMNGPGVGVVGVTGPSASGATGPSTGIPTLGSEIESYRSDPEFDQYRRELQSQAALLQQAQQNQQGLQPLGIPGIPGGRTGV